MADDACLRPLSPEERPWLDRLAFVLRELRLEAGLSQARLAARAGLAERSVRRLEHGQRRTRGSTLQRLAVALTREPSVLGTAEAVLALLLEAAGPSLAAESQYSERIDGRRKRRLRRARREIGAGVVQHFVDARENLAGGVLEHHRHRRWVGRRSFRETSYLRFIANEDVQSVTEERGGNFNLVYRSRWPSGETLTEYATGGDWQRPPRAVR